MILQNMPRAPLFSILYDVFQVGRTCISRITSFIAKIFVAKFFAMTTTCLLLPVQNRDRVWAKTPRFDPTLPSARTPSGTHIPSIDPHTCRTHVRYAKK